MLLWTRLSNVYVWVVLFVLLSFGAIGFIDDYRKVIRKNPKGLIARITSYNVCYTKLLRKLDIEWRHLLLEQNALAEHSRVSDIAREKLNMARPAPLSEKLVTQS